MSWVSLLGLLHVKHTCLNLEYLFCKICAATDVCPHDNTYYTGHNLYSQHTSNVFHIWVAYGTHHTYFHRALFLIKILPLIIPVISFKQTLVYLRRKKGTTTILSKEMPAARNPQQTVHTNIHLHGLS